MQTEREKANAVDMHTTFQQELVKLRLATAKAYLQVLTDGQVWLLPHTTPAIARRAVLCYAMLCHAVVRYSVVWYGIIWYGMVFCYLQCVLVGGKPLWASAASSAYLVPTV